MKLPVGISALLATVVFVPLAPAKPLFSLQPVQQQSDQQEGPGMGQQQLEEHSVRGDVTAISGSTISIKTDDGETYSVATGPNTRFRKQRDQIKITDIHVGDMVAAVGDKDPKAKTVGAAFIVVIDREQYEKMRADFGKTWTAGVVQSIDGTNIVIKRPDNVVQTVAVDENTAFRRRREDITFPEIKVGDNITVRGALQNGAFLATAVNVGGPGRLGGGGEYHSRQPSDAGTPPPNN